MLMFMYCGGQWFVRLASDTPVQKESHIIGLVSSGQSRTEEVAELCHTWWLTILTPKILVTLFYSS